MDTQSMQVDMNKRVDQAVKLRDKIKEIKERHKQELAPYEDAFEKLEGLFLDHLNKNGADRVGTEAGTVYRAEKKSASIADKTAFWTFVVTQNLWDMIDYKANPSQVAEYIEQNGTEPPGVNYSVMHTVNIRRK